MDASDRRDRVAEEAAEWWVVLQGDASRADREQYVDWLRESSVHVAEMLRVAQVHGALEQFKRWSGIPIDGSRDADDSVVRLPTPEGRVELRKDTQDRGPRRRAVAWSVAATLIVATGLVAILLIQSRGRTIQTDRGERREVALADGSVIQVDPETRLRVKYEDHARRVFLERGRALFHVAKSTERPFLVEANNTTVRAVGTAFAVERHHESIVVTVAEGKVAVFPAYSLATPLPVTLSPSGSPDIHSKVAQGASVSSTLSVASTYQLTRHGLQSEPPPALTGSTSEIFLTANQQVTVSKSGSAEAVLVVDSSRALAWADGRLVLENRTVADAVREFNRYNRIQIKVNDAELARRPVSGVFNAADPQSFVAFLASVARLHIKREEGTDITIDAAKEPDAGVDIALPESKTLEVK
jgi:transmembrane sensor